MNLPGRDKLLPAVPPALRFPLGESPNVQASHEGRRTRRPVWRDYPLAPTDHLACCRANTRNAFPLNARCTDRPTLCSDGRLRSVPFPLSSCRRSQSVTSASCRPPGGESPSMPLLFFFLYESVL